MRKLVRHLLTVVNPRIPANLSGRRPQKHWAVSPVRRRPPSASEGSPKDIGPTVFEIYRRRGKGRAPRASQSSPRIPRRVGVLLCKTCLWLGFPAQCLDGPYARFRIFIQRHNILSSTPAGGTGIPGLRAHSGVIYTE